jgi:hypothetical protein
MNLARELFALRSLLLAERYPECFPVRWRLVLPVPPPLAMRLVPPVLPVPLPLALRPVQPVRLVLLVRPV